MVRINEACKSLGVSPSTLRNLERRASLRITRDHAGHRRYSEADLQVLNQIFFGGKTSIAQGEKKNED